MAISFGRHLDLEEFQTHTSIRFFFYIPRLYRYYEGMVRTRVHTLYTRPVINIKRYVITVMATAPSVFGFRVHNYDCNSIIYNIPLVVQEGAVSYISNKGANVYYAVYNILFFSTTHFGYKNKNES